ncbi:hypothetical protein KJ766_01950 [Patescibacteria group bacterium]|nr:hypothetical protein [Patescibacteria group bacterium]
MFSAIFTKNQSIFLVLSVALAGINILTISSASLGAILLLFFLATSGKMIGSFYTNDPLKQLFLGTLSVLSYVATIGTIIFYIANLSQTIFYIIILSVTAIAILIQKKEKIQLNNEKQYWQTWAIATCIAVLSAIWIYAVNTFSITESVRSPWDIVQPEILIIFFLLTIATTTLLFIKNRNRLFLGALFCTLFCALTIASIVYPLGFGFDPFVHNATLEHIAGTGSISPKPLYYIGQYSLQIALYFVFSIPFSIQAFLVPVLASVFLTASAWIGFEGLLGKKQTFALASLFLIPFGAFIMTTPQNLAYIFVACIVFLSLPIIKKSTAKNWIIVLLLLVATLCIHPLAGVPAAVYCTILFIATSTMKQAIKNTLLAFTGFIGAICMPIIFLIQAKLSNLPIQINFGGLLDLSNFDFSFFLQNTANSALDGIYLFAENQLWIILLIGLCSIWILKKQNAPQAIFAPLYTALIFLFSYWLLAGLLEFDFLIEYEKQDYANRLLILVMIFAIPAVGITFTSIANTLQKKSATAAFAFILIISFCASANTYAAYPINDGHTRSAGFNVSQSDIDASWMIHDIGKDNEYIVLSNQALAAAALQEFGFYKYYNENIFYYPIPTGGTLYQYFLQMADQEPSRDVMIEAMDTAGVDTGFFVLHDYWWDSQKIREHAKQNADDWITVGDSEITIFIYYR